MWRKAVLLAAFVVSVQVQVQGLTTQVEQCISNEGDLPIEVNVEGCITPPCSLPKLQDAVIHLVFKANKVVHSMRTLATAYMSIGFLTVPVPYPLGAEEVTCNYLTNSYCPLLQDEIVSYTLKMFIEEVFPTDTTTTIEFRVVDQDSNPMLCIRMPIRIDPPLEGKRQDLQ